MSGWILLLVGFSAVYGTAVWVSRPDRQLAFSLRSAEVSERGETELGRRLAGECRFVNDAAALPRVEAIGRRVAAGVSRTGITYHFHVVSSPYANAFSFPGGEVYITTGMLATLRGDDELAAILGHEIAHVDLRHCLTRYQYSLKLRGPGRFADLARTLLTLQYAKSQELEADVTGRSLAARAGFDPAALARVLHHIEAGSAAPARASAGLLGSWWNTHPDPAERARRLNP